MFATDWCRPPQYAVKVIDPSKEEADILDSLQRDLACPSSHVVPCEVVRSDKFLAIMPRLVGVEILFYPKNLSSTLDVFDQLLEVRNNLGPHYEPFADIPSWPGNHLLA